MVFSALQRFGSTKKHLSIQSDNNGELKESNPFPSIIVHSPILALHSSASLTTGQRILSGIQPRPADAAATLPGQARDPLSRKEGVEIVAFTREGAQVFPGAREVFAPAICAGPGMPGGAGDVDGVGGRVHGKLTGEDRGSVSGCLGIADERNCPVGFKGQECYAWKREKGLKGGGTTYSFDIPEIEASRAVLEI